MSLAASATPADPPSSAEELERQMLDTNVAVSEWLNGIAQDIDLFLAGKKITNKKNETNFRIEYTTFSSEGKGLNNAVGFNMDVRLPNVEEYWNLKFNTYDEQEARRGAQNARFAETKKETNYGATVGLFRRLGRVKTAFQPRVEVKDPLKISHSLSFETTYNFAIIQFTPKVEFYAQADRGTGIYVALPLNRELGKKHALSFVNNERYEDKLKLFTSENGVVIGRALSESAGISYLWLFNSRSQPTYYLDSYTVAVSYSQSIYKNVFDVNFTPHLDFAKARDFTGLAGANFNMNWKF